MTVVGIVENNPDVVEMLQTGMDTMPDVDSVVIPSTEAIKSALWKNVDVAVVDLDMEVPGEDILTYLHSDHPNIKRVVASAAHERVLKIAGLADEVLLKPYNLRLLERIISDPRESPVIESDEVILARKVAEVKKAKLKKKATVILVLGAIGLASILVNTGNQVLFSPSLSSSPSSTLVSNPNHTFRAAPTPEVTTIPIPNPSQPFTNPSEPMSPVFVGIPALSPVPVIVQPSLTPQPTVSTTVPPTSTPHGHVGRGKVKGGGKA